MKTVRWALSAITILLLGGGFVLAMVSAATGEAAAHAVRMDEPAVRVLALALVLICVVLAFVRDGGPDSGDR